MKILINFAILLLFALLTSCVDSPDLNNESKEPDLLLKPSMFLKNVIINNDTLFLDKDFNTDCRVEIPGYKINRIRLKVNNESFISHSDTSVFSMNMFIIQQYNEFNASAVVTVTNSTTLKRSTLTSKPFIIKAVKDLYNLYVRKDCADGKLKLSWPVLDKLNTKSYIVEKYLGDNLIEQNEVVGDSCFVDQTYVGEEVIYKISTLNKDNVIQRTFGFIKAKESPKIRIEQNSVSGYTMYWSKNKYYSNFKKYDLVLSNTYTGDKTIMTSENINDTSLYMSNAPFGGEVRFYLIQSPKIYPTLITEKQKNIYSNFIYGHFGIPSIDYDALVVLDKNSFAYTRAGKIYKYNLLSNLTTDSIVNNGASYEYLYGTPQGKYIYSHDYYKATTTLDFWKTDKFTDSPLLTFDTSYKTYFFTDELATVSCTKNNSTNLYYITTKNIQTNQSVSEIEIQESMGIMGISKNGEYLIGQNPNCSLFRFKDNKWTKVWADAHTTNYKTFYSFDPQDPTRLYLYNNDTFSIISLTDYTILKSYPFTGSIINIDFNTKLMLATADSKILIMNVDTGVIIKEIISDNYELFGYDYCTRLIGNVIYSGRGVKYIF